ncbi:hypothetical protein [Streptomyces sp. TR02-1]|uniref:hypothetical protein n=1 Tax=Streptomyces sp. TR02-1 TaxID=3385977 RepID=UPI0039A23DA8
MSGKGGDHAEFSEQYEEANMCFPGEVITPFATSHTIDSMKAMMAGAKPEAVLGVADAWESLHDLLVSGGGSIKGDFDKAVQHVLAHWEGASADEFAKKARKISKQIADCATYAGHTSVAMRNAGKRLQDIKPQVDAIEKPDSLDSAMNSLGDGLTRDDSKWRGEIQNNQGARNALENHHDDLSAGREEQLRTAALMEDLALAYSSQSKTMGSWEKRKAQIMGDEDYPGEPGGIAPVPVIVAPGGSGISSDSPGHGSTTPSDSLPATRTRLDRLPGSGLIAPTDGPVGTGRGAPVGGGPGGGPVNETPGGPGLVGRASGNRGAAGGATRAGGPASGRSGPSGAGAGREASGRSGGGPLARQRGGKSGTPATKGVAGRQGGQGLHSSRGGTQAGQRGRKAPLHRGGAAPTGNARKKNTESSDDQQRPDYLIEDEETWMPKGRKDTPPTVD